MMKTLSLTGTICALLAVSEPIFAAAPRLSLKDAVQYAAAHSPALDTAAKTRSIRDLEYKSAWAKMLPSADFSTTDGLQNNIPVASTTAANVVIASNPAAPWYSSLSLGLTENLYDNGVSLTGLSVASLNQELAQVDYDKARDRLALDVASEFYRLSLATVLLEVRKQQQSILDKQFKTLTSQYHQGFKTRSDYLRFKSQVQRAEIDRVTAESGVIQSEALLRKLSGVNYREAEPPSFESVVVDRAQKSEAILAAGRAPALEVIYDFRAAKIQEEINGKSVDLARRTYLPQVSLASGVNYINQNYLNSGAAFSAGHQLSWNVLVTVQYNLWDWGTRRRALEVSGLSRDIQGNSISLGLLDIQAQVTALMADIGRISRNYKLTQELLSLEEESNRDVEAQYREGKVTYLDLVTELNNLLDAKVQFFTSYFDALASAAKYKYYEGKLYESLAEK